jgi:phosphatidylserine decarboxylase
MVRDGYIYGLSLLAVAVFLVWFTGSWAWAIAPVVLAGFFCGFSAILIAIFQPARD